MGYLRNFKIYLLFFLIFNLLACVSGHCPSEYAHSDPRTVKSRSSRVWVFKYDNSKQCEPESGISKEKMLEEFKNIKVWDTQQKNDGQPRVQFCGAYTGNANLFLVDKKDALILKSRGYEVWDY